MQSDRKKLYGNALLASAFLVGNAFSNQEMGRLQNKDLDRQSDISNQSYQVQLKNLENKKTSDMNNMYNFSARGNTLSGVGTNQLNKNQLIADYNRNKNLLYAQEQERQYNIAMQKKKNDNAFFDTLLGGAFSIFTALI